MNTVSECELCGAKATRKAKVEGTVLDVCDDCVKFGEAVDKVDFKKKIPIPKLEGSEQVMVKDFHKTIRRSREKKKLTQEELAKKLNEKASVIKRIEEGWQPPNKLIEKIEKFFNLKLREEAVETLKQKKAGSQKLTIGDIIEVG